MVSESVHDDRWRSPVHLGPGTTTDRGAYGIGRPGKDREVKKKKKSALPGRLVSSANKGERTGRHNVDNSDLA